MHPRKLSLVTLVLFIFQPTPSNALAHLYPFEYPHWDIQSSRYTPPPIAHRSFTTPTALYTTPQAPMIQAHPALPFSHNQKHFSPFPTYGDRPIRETVKESDFLYVRQHEVGFSDSKRKYPAIVTDHVIDCVAGTVWNPSQQKGCVFHFDRDTAPAAIDDALSSVRKDSPHQDIIIRLFSSYDTTSHFSELIHRILELGFTISSCDAYPYKVQGNIENHRNSPILNNTKTTVVNGQAIQTSQAFLPRKVCLDTRDGAVYTDFRIPDHARYTNPHSQRSMQYHSIWNNARHRLSYFNEEML